jgi:hypothetical protein
MTLYDRIKGALRRDPPTPKLRNKPGGMAFIKGLAPSVDGQDALNGRVVQTIRLNERGAWLIDPVQRFTVKARVFYVPIQQHANPGDTAIVGAMEDEFLEPFREDGSGISEIEVTSLYSPSREKEPA